MNGYVILCMNGWMDEQVNEWMCGWLWVDCEQMNIDRYLSKQMDMDKQIVESMSGWMTNYKDEQGDIGRWISE